MRDIESDMFNYIDIYGKRRHVIIYQVSDYCSHTDTANNLYN